MTKNDVDADDVAEAFQTILDADKKVLAEHYENLNEQQFEESSAVHSESDLRAWVQQDFIKSVLGHLHGVPAKLCIELDNPGETDL